MSDVQKRGAGRAVGDLYMKDVNVSADSGIRIWGFKKNKTHATLRTF